MTYTHMQAEFEQIIAVNLLLKKLFLYVYLEQNLSDYS